ncbi:MAG: hypothetical protein WCG32_02860 [Actinomycetes bacterium]
MTIEVVSNNNTITAFAGCAADKDGTLGYLPAPKAGAQNSYLCGNGTWQSATVGPFAAQYLHVFRDISADVAAGTPVIFPRIIANVGTAIGFSAPFSAFVLAPGYSYKLMCYNNFSGTTASGPYQWYNSTAATLIGITGNLQSSGDFCQGPAIAYISPTVSTSVSIYGCNSTGLVKGIATRCDTIASSGVGQYYFLGFSVTIEVVANNNNITAFSGCDATKDGIVGYIPAPKAGNQNMFLRGDGQWQNAYAANYYYASLTSAPAANTPMVFNTNAVPAGTAITMTNGSSFSLAVGYTYKITVCVNYNTGAGGYPNDYTIVRLYNNGTEFGTPGYGLIGVASNSPIIGCGYVIPTVTANITVKVNYACILLPGFINIEVVSGNNAITGFVGATADKDGIVGYIPPPKAGSQNMFLRGDGSWQNATAAQYYYAALTSNPVANTNMVFNTDVLNIGTAITASNGSSFTLQPGYTYKIYAGAINNTAIDGSLARANIKLYNNGVVFGSNGEAYSNNSNTSIPCYAFGYLSATTTAATLTVRALNTNTSPPGYITIEVVSGNNAITAFKGATTNTDGGVGYIPAPPAGTQNSYLRGDGTWQQANNAPTTASILYATCYTDQTIYLRAFTSATGPFQALYFDTPLLPATANITQNTITQSGFSNAYGTTFTLAASGSYKLTGSIGFTENENGSFQWFNVTTSTLIGNACNIINGVSSWNSNILAYVTTAATPVTVALVGTQVSQGTLRGTNYKNNIQILSWGPYINIEQVSNNNTIAAFAGATATTNGVVGYIPAPPAGTQNSYLRGDGTWQQANNAPTAAAYMHVTNMQFQAVVNQPFEFATTVTSTGNYIIHPNSTSFILQAGNTYKCTASIGACTVATNGIGPFALWSTSTTGTAGYFGTGAGMDTSYYGWQAVGYISPTINTTIYFMISSVNVPPAYMVANYSWATIEVVSNNNTITQFTGCTASQNGSIGYIPAPPAGTQNSYLRGDGTWQKANNAPTAAIYLFALNTTNGYVTTIGTPIPFPVIQQQSGISGVIGYTTPFSNFTIQPGYTYKLSAGCNYATTPGSFQWATNISSVVGYIGVAGDTYQYAGGPAIAYISPSVETIVGVYAVQGGLTMNVYVGLSFWMTIEVVSNNNTITAFTGATATTNGIVGYIPAPLAGQQNHVLTGAGRWAAPGPTFSAYKTINQPSTGSVIVTFDKIDFDPENFFNISSSSYKPNVAGYYQVNASVYYETNLTAGSYQLYLNKNGAVYKRGTNAEIPQSTQGLGINMSTVVSMNGTTDYIQISTDKQNNNAVVNMIGDPSGSLTWFNAIMVRPLL